MKIQRSNFMGLTKRIFTASRRGSTKTKTGYTLNMFLMGVITLTLYAIWAVCRNLAFPDFSPFSYWNLMGGNLWNNIVVIAIPVAVYAIFNGLIDVFNQSDDDGTLYAENILFKGIVSLSAGVWEELLHRGVLIWIGLIMVWTSNYLFKYELFLFLFLLVLGALTTRWWLGIFMALIAFFVWMFAIQFENPIYQLNGLTLYIYQWIVADSIRLLIVYFLVVLLAFLTLSSQLSERGRSLTSSIHPMGILLQMAGLLAWAVYAMPKGVFILGNLPILPAGADHWTVLLYVGAVIWTNVKFKEGHAYQGAVGQLNSYIFAFYMIYIAFTFGLVYAILVHFIYDALLLLSEHAVHVVRNRKLASD